MSKQRPTHQLSKSKQRKMAARRRARMRRRLMIGIGAVVVAGLIGTAFIVLTGSGDEEGSLVANDGKCMTSDSTDLTTKPTVTIPKDETPPTTLQSCDLVVGTGDEATPGKDVKVQYVGVAWSTGQQFDASWDSSGSFDFPLGQGRVIQGGDQGVAGMKVGGRRELVIPPDLGYGERGAGGAIGPNETLVFIVDLLKVG
jgi:peptidylprolyl isomerase